MLLFSLLFFIQKKYYIKLMLTLMLGEQCGLWRIKSRCTINRKMIEILIQTPMRSHVS